MTVWIKSRARAVSQKKNAIVFIDIFFMGNRTFYVRLAFFPFFKKPRLSPKSASGKLRAARVCSIILNVHVCTEFFSWEGGQEAACAAIFGLGMELLSGRASWRCTLV